MMEGQYKEVSKEEFFQAINNLNVHPYPIGDYHSDNYRSQWKLPDGRIVGKSVPYGNTPHYKPNTRWYLSTALEEPRT